MCQRCLTDNASVIKTQQPSPTHVGAASAAAVAFLEINVGLVYRKNMQTLSVNIAESGVGMSNTAKKKNNNNMNLENSFFRYKSMYEVDSVAYAHYAVGGFGLYRLELKSNHNLRNSAIIQ